MARTTEKPPALPWYPKDFQADEPVVAMTLEAEGAYRRLLDHQWLHGSIPSDLHLLAGICKNIPQARMRVLWAQMSMLFAPIPDDPERLRNAKLERVRKEREDFIARKREAGRRGAAATNGAAKRRQESGSADILPPPLPGSVPPANGRPASASASASASARGTNQQQQPARDGAADVVRIAPAASWPQLHGKLPPVGLYRQQVMGFVASLPEAQAEGWCSLLLQQLAGVGTPGGVAVTADELLAAIAHYRASRKGEHDTRYFEGCVRNVVKRRYGKPEVPEQAPPKAGARLPRLTDPDLKGAS